MSKAIMDECFFVFRPAIKEQLKPTKRLVSDIWKPYRMKIAYSDCIEDFWVMALS